MQLTTAQRYEMSPAEIESVQRLIHRCATCGHVASEQDLDIERRHVGGRRFGRIEFYCRGGVHKGIVA